jgi:hypothetical protein
MYARGLFDGFSGDRRLGDKSTARPTDTSGLNRSPEHKEALRRAEVRQECEGRARVLALLHEEKASLDLIYAFEKTGYFVQSGCRDEWNAAQLKEWDGRLREYRRRVTLEARTIDLCFKLGYESGRSELSEQRRLATSGLGIAVLSAHERGTSSFAVEQIFREVWLDAVVRRPQGSEWDPTDHHRFDHIDMASIRNLLNQVHDSLIHTARSVSIGAVIEKRIEKIKAARATADTWFGRPPAPGQEGDGEKVFVVEEIHHAISHCEQSGVPQDVIESMLLRSWVRMLVFNEHEDELFCQILDQHWNEVHAAFQLHMTSHSGLLVQ